jgi:hypothetical protein
MAAASCADRLLSLFAVISKVLGTSLIPHSTGVIVVLEPVLRNRDQGMPSWQLEQEQEVTDTAN